MSRNYLSLYHGRTNPNETPEDWGTDGPVLGPYDVMHANYNHCIKLCSKDGDHLLWWYDDLIYYDGVYYGDWVFGPGMEPTAEYDAKKAELNHPRSKTKVVITCKQGLIDWHVIPRDCDEVILWDYDTEGVEPDELVERNGEMCIETILLHKERDIR